MGEQGALLLLLFFFFHFSFLFLHYMLQFIMCDPFPKQCVISLQNLVSGDIKVCCWCSIFFDTLDFFARFYLYVFAKFPFLA